MYFLSQDKYLANPNLLGESNMLDIHMKFLRFFMAKSFFLSKTLTVVVHVHETG